MATYIGVDFTSRPTSKKPIVFARLVRENQGLVLQGFQDLTRAEKFAETIGGFQDAVIGIDAPFGFATAFLNDMHWGDDWQAYMARISGLAFDEYVGLLDAYRKNQPDGKKEHRRLCDKRCGAVSPQKLYGVPVGRMLYAVAPLLCDERHDVWPFRVQGMDRLIVEAYPGVSVRHLVGRTSYKDGTTIAQLTERSKVRGRIVDMLTQRGEVGEAGSDCAALRASGLLPVSVEDGLRDVMVDDVHGDHLDALVCALQAACVDRASCDSFVLPGEAYVEGWIVNPADLKLTPDHA